MFLLVSWACYPTCMLGKGHSHPTSPVTLWPWIFAVIGDENATHLYNLYRHDTKPLRIPSWTNAYVRECQPLAVLNVAHWIFFFILRIHPAQYHPPRISRPSWRIMNHPWCLNKWSCCFLQHPLQSRSPVRELIFVASRHGVRWSCYHCHVTVLTLR